MDTVSKPSTPRTNRNTNIVQWSLDVIELARANVVFVMNDTPIIYREAIGGIHDWSPKDEFAHLAYWVDVFETNIRAFRTNKPLINTSDYLVMNDNAWITRKDWTWEYIEQEVLRVLAATKMQIAQLEVDDLINSTRFTVDPNNGKARPLLRSLLYELIDHPLHHFIGLYKKFGANAHTLALLANTSSILTQSGVSKWAISSRRKIQAYEKRLQSTN